MRNLSVLLLACTAELGCLTTPITAQAPTEKSLSILMMRVEQKDDVALRLQAIMSLADYGPKAEPAIPYLLDALQTKNEDLRLNAAITLAKIGKAALPAVGALLKAEDDDTRFYALWTIGWVGPEAKQLTPAIIKLMTDKNEGIRRKAAYALGRLAGDPQRTIEVLVEAFKDESDEVRQAAGEALAKFGKTAVPPLLELLKQMNPKARLQAAQSLGEIGADAKAAVPLLKELFLAEGDNPSPFAQVLAKIGKASMPALEAGFKDARPNVRQAAAQAMAQLGADAVPVLVDALGDKNVEVRRLAAQTLWPMRIGDKMVVTALAYGLNDPDDSVRQMCMQGLAQLGPLAKLGAPKLKEALTDMNPNIRRQAYYLLSSFGEDMRPSMQKALASKDDKVRINTACLMLNVNYQPDLAMPVVVAALKNEDLGLRMQAAFALAQRQQQTDKLLPLFLEGLKHSSAGVRTQAVQGLGMLRNKGGDKAAVGLAQALGDADANVRQSAVNSMHSVAGAGEAVAPVLLKVFRQGDAGVRQSVMQVCWRYGVKTKDLVVEGLKDKNGSVRQQALYALQNMQVDRAEMIPTLVTLLRDKDSDVNLRVQVSHILRNISPKMANAALAFKKMTPALKDALHDANPTVRMNVVVILATVGGEGPEFLIKQYQGEKDINARMSLMPGLVYSGNSKLAMSLVKITMKDPSVQVRQNTVNMLYAFGQDSKEGFEAFALGLKDADAQVRITAANRGNVFGAKSWDLFEETLKTTKDGNLRQAVLQGLQATNYRTRSGVPALTDCLKDANPTVRMFACNLLANMGQDAASALPQLRALTKDANPSVQQSARVALQRIEAKK